MRSISTARSIRAKSYSRQAAVGGVLVWIALTGAAAAQKPARVQVDLKTVLAKVPAAGYGVGMSVYDNDFTSPTLPERLKAAGVTALRFPGGSYSDAYHWKDNSRTAGTTLYINPNDTFDHFMEKDVLPSGAQAVITVNYGSNAAGNGGGDPAEAAEWVRYANQVKGWKIRYWEIGNEIGGNGYFGTQWEEDLHSPLDGKDPRRKGNPVLSMTAYGRNSLEFIRAMKAVDPTIQIGAGVNMPDADMENPPLLKEVKDKIDFVIVHWYPKGSATDLTVTDDIKPQAAALRDEIAKYAGASQHNIPFAITETNGGGSGASRALFATDDFLTWFEAGAINVEWQEMHNGFLSDVKDVPLDTPTEAYYGLQMAATAARPGDELLAATSSAPLLGVHAVRRKDGGVAVVLINKHPTQPFAVSVAIPGASLVASGTRYDFGRANFGASPEWASTGIAQSSIDGLGDSFTVTVPAMTESVVVIPAK
jgi:hypothetical protein